MSGNAPMPTGSLPGTHPYQPGMPAPADHRPPPPPAGDGGGLAIAALLLSLLGCFGFPLLYVVTPTLAGKDVAFEALIVAMVIGAIVVVASIVLSIWALVVARRGQSGRKAMAVSAVIIACLSPITGAAAAFFGILLVAGGGVHGRPLRRRNGKHAVAEDGEHPAWSAGAIAPRTEGLTRAEREALAAAWLADARLEHASIAAFGRVALDLLAISAPPELVLRAHRAAAEEIEHARAAFSLASAYAGAPRGPAAFPEAASAWSPDGESMEVRVARVVRESIVDGCVGEGAAARAAEEATAVCDDPVVTSVLSRIAVDEASHAALAADIVTWALREHPVAARRGREAASRALSLQLGDAAAPASEAPPGETCELPGRLPTSRHVAIRRSESARVRDWLGELARDAA
jgi:hypothetical protein